MEQLRAIAGQDYSESLFSRPRTADALAHALWHAAELGDPQAALSLSNAVNLLTKTLGPDHPYTLVSRNNLASAYQDVGRLDEAIDLFEQNLAEALRVLGPDHPDTKTFRNSLADAYRAVGRSEDAEALLDPPSDPDDTDTEAPTC